MRITKEGNSIELERKEEEKMVTGRDEDGGTVVVGMKMDAQSRELLTWALVKVAQPGDSVVALHILPNSVCFDGKPSSSMDSITNAFNSLLSVYEGFCGLKQIDLKLSICQGSSIRKVLVRETARVPGAKLILGAAESNRVIGISLISIAKYCGKKLPDECSVLAVNNGKIVFQREAKGSRNGRKIQHSSSKNLMLLEGSNDNSLCLLPAKKYGISNSNGRKIHHTPSKNLMLLNGSNDNSFCVLPSKKYGLNGRNDSEKNSRSAGIRGSSSSTVGAYCTSDAQLKENEGSLALVPDQTTQTSSGSISVLIRSLQEERPGWPLLHKATLHRRSSFCDESNVSVVQWAMRLPNRYMSSWTPNHEVLPVMQETKAICNPYSDMGAIIPVEYPICNEESPRLPKEVKFLHDKYGSTCRLFKYRELVVATSNFSAEHLIGKGGSSCVYKGVLPDGQELAVKILKRSDEILQEFITEIETITTLDHINIISLCGYCFDRDNLILVYDFLSRGSLEENLHGLKKSKNSFGWDQRYNVAVGVAEALNYLHGCDMSRPVIHRDVKSSNILLSENFEPQLSDFGLAMRASSTSSHISCSDVVGTFGYLAPEYFMFGRVSDKIDVYAFGVVLLELLSGRKPIEDEHLKGQESLVIWAKPILQSGNFTELLDPSFGCNYDEDQLERMILAASLCIARAPRLRPSIAVVLKLLRGDDAELIRWARLQVNAPEEREGLEEGTVACTAMEFQSHLNLALLDVEDDDLSVSSVDHALDYIMAHSSLEAYLQERWSRSSSFN